MADSILKKIRVGAYDTATAACKNEGKSIVKICGLGSRKFLASIPGA